MKLSVRRGIVSSLCYVALTLIVGLQLGAQPSSPVQFDVASIRRSAMTGSSSGPASAPVVTGGPGTSNPNQVSYRGIWLTTLISMAFDLKEDQISGPSWLRDERYDIIANVPAGATRDQLNEMLRNLLAQRFGLRYHRELKQGSAYALRVGKDGPKLHVSSDASASENADAPRTAIGAADAQGYPTLPASYKGIVGRVSNGILFLAGQSVTIPQIIRWLEGPLGASIVNETGLGGKYDVKVSLLARPQSATGPIPIEPAPTVFDAVQQLGLRLEKIPVATSVLVVDSVLREPTPN